MRFPNDIADKDDSFVTIEKDHWEKNWEHGVRKRPLSLLNVFNRDAIALLSEPLLNATNPVIVEIGFVPGKYLQFFEKRFNARMSWIRLLGNWLQTSKPVFQRATVFRTCTSSRCFVINHHKFQIEPNWFIALALLSTLKILLE